MADHDTVVHCDGPDCAHAFDVIPVKPRPSPRDVMCPDCHGHGEWNAQIDLGSFHSVRSICPRCHGTGWLGPDAARVAVPDIVQVGGGEPHWVDTCRPSTEWQSKTGEQT